MRRVTQSDVARHAGVSRFTVSCVINNRMGGNVRISPETRQRVLDAIDHLGYKPNIVARSLRTSKTKLLAVLVPDIANPFYPLFIRGVEKVVSSQGYDILILDANEMPEREHFLIDKALQRLVDGLIMIPFYLAPGDLEPLSEADTPIVMVHGEEQAKEFCHLPNIIQIVPDERQGVLDLMDHLISRGHRRIAHLAGPQNTPPGRIRCKYYRQALETHGIPYDDSLVTFGTFKSENTSQQVTALFARSAGSEQPTALFAANDLMAVEAIQTLKRMGKHIPQDVAVVGFDNIPEANIVVPGLTTVDNDPMEIGLRAGHRLLAQLEEPASAETSRCESTPCKLVLRESA